MQQYEITNPYDNSCRGDVPMNILFGLYFVGLLYAFGASLGRGRELINLFPSLVWGFQMVLPYLIQRPLFSPEYAPIQGQGILIVGFALLVADSISARRMVRDNAAESIFDRVSTGYVFLAVSLILQISHLLLMPRIPLLEEWFGNNSGRELETMREMASKYLSVPRPYIYLCQSTVNVLAPLAVALLFRHRRYFSSGILFVSTLFYSMATLAKSPSWIFVSLCALLLYSGMKRENRKKVFIVASALFLVGMFFIGRFLLHNPWSVFNWRLEPKQLKVEIAKRSGWAGPKMPRVFTMTDHYRIHFINGVNYPLLGLERKINHLSYYLFLAPADVAH